MRKIEVRPEPNFEALNPEENKPAPLPRYGARGGRVITKDGEPWFYIGPMGAYSPTKMDVLTVQIALAMNAFSNMTNTNFEDMQVPDKAREAMWNSGEPRT